jgi:hypothetical protein
VKAVEHLAFVLIGAGLLALIGYLARGFFFSDEVSVVLRIICAIAAVGFILLLGYVGWDRYRSAKKEPKEIKEADK